HALWACAYLGPGALRYCARRFSNALHTALYPKPVKGCSSISFTLSAQISVREVKVGSRPMRTAKLSMRGLGRVTTNITAASAASAAYSRHLFAVAMNHSNAVTAMAMMVLLESA